MERRPSRRVPLPPAPAPSPSGGSERFPPVLGMETATDNNRKNFGEAPYKRPPTKSLVRGVPHHDKRAK